MAHRKLTPQQSVVLIGKGGPRDMVSDISPVDIGHKALGLSTLPSDWTPPYFVVSSECWLGGMSRKHLNDWITACVTRTVSGRDSLMVRSSGTGERMGDRGSLPSKHCSAQEIAPTINDLSSRLEESSRSRVHWIVQEAIESQRRGHLSNERRLSREPRDWVVEFEAAANKPGHVVRLGIRTWREGSDLPSLDLACGAEIEITIRLRAVAKWGMQFESRIHFEWVWDGQRLWIVQADAEESTGGTDPTSILSTSLQRSNVGVLRDFHLATGPDFQSYDKLGKAELYQKLGYQMPPFFVADDPEVMAGILEGNISCDLEKDLNELIGRPLIIRTDGIGIPSDKREMLPRSDPLTTTSEAKDWLLINFRDEINRAQLENTRLCLIAHHFIPSVASAWARAEPEARLVRIEALWGIPEGLYWYSHDTFEVDTMATGLSDIKSVDNSQFKLVLRRLRYKGTFVATDEHGKWAPSKVSAPFDWRISVTKQRWLFEIALITRCIANKEGHPVAVMWLINNHPSATQHGVLPWYHSKSTLVDPRGAAPRRKLTTSDDFVVTNESDWDKLCRRLDSGPPVERVVVQPMDAALIRNPTFARELGTLGAAKRFVIELAGEYCLMRTTS